MSDKIKNTIDYNKNIFEKFTFSNTTKKDVSTENGTIRNVIPEANYNPNLNGVETINLDDSISEGISDFETNIKTSDNIDYGTELEKAKISKQEQENILNNIQNDRTKIEHIIEDSTDNVTESVVSDYQKDYSSVDDKFNEIHAHYSGLVQNGIGYTEGEKAVVENISSSDFMKMTPEEFVEAVFRYDSSAKKEYENAKNDVEIKYQDTVSALQENGYNFNNFGEVIQYFSELNQFESKIKLSIIEIDRLIKILPYQEMMSTNEYINYKDNHVINSNFLTNSFDENMNYSWNKYLEYENISPVDFLKQIEENDEYYNRAFVLNEKNLSVNALHNLIEASKTNPDLMKGYNYLYYTKGIDAANLYLSDIGEEINKTIALEHVKEFQNGLNSGDSIGDCFDRSLTITTKGLGDGIKQFANGVGAWFSNDTNRTVADFETMYIGMLLQPNSIKEQAGLIDENGISTSSIDYSIDYSGKLNISDNIYEISTSIGNMLPSMTISMFNPMLGTISMGVSAGGNSYHQRIVEGSDRGRAMIYGALSGLSEAALERVLGTLPFISDANVTSFKDLILAMPKEALEEGTQELFDIGLSYALYGEKITLEEAAQRVGKSSLYGAITSGIMNFPGVTVNTAGQIVIDTYNQAFKAKMMEITSSIGIDMQESEIASIVDYVNKKGTPDLTGISFDTINETVENNSIEFSVQSDIDSSKQAFTVENILAYLESHQGLGKEFLQKITIVDSEYSLPSELGGGHVAAISGNGEIIIYANEIFSADVLSHELAHLYDEQTNMSSSEEWQQAVLNDGNYVTDSTNLKEDFAESLALFEKNPSLLNQYPHRKALIETAIELMNKSDIDSSLANVVEGEVNNPSITKSKNYDIWYNFEDYLDNKKNPIIDFIKKEIKKLSFENKANLLSYQTSSETQGYKIINGLLRNNLFEYNENGNIIGINIYGMFKNNYYTLNDYAEIILKEGEFSNFHDWLLYCKDSITNMKNTLENFSLSRNIVVYRGVKDFTFLNNKFGVSSSDSLDVLQQKLIGQTIFLDGFTSTSITDKSGPLTRNDLKIKYKIFAKKGTPSFDMHILGVENEQELLLLTDGIEFKITDVQTDSNGIPIVSIEMTEQYNSASLEEKIQTIFDNYEKNLPKDILNQKLKKVINSTILTDTKGNLIQSLNKIFDDNNIYYVLSEPKDKIIAATNGIKEYINKSLSIDESNLNDSNYKDLYYMLLDFTNTENITFDTDTYTDILMNLINENKYMRDAIMIVGKEEIEQSLKTVHGITDSAFVDEIFQSILGGNDFLSGGIGEGIDWDHYADLMSKCVKKKVQEMFNGGKEPVIWGKIADEYHSVMDDKYTTVHNTSIGDEVYFLDLAFPNYDKSSSVKLMDWWSNVSAIYVEAVCESINPTTGHPISNIKFLYPSNLPMDSCFGDLFKRTEFPIIMDYDEIDTITMTKVDPTTMEILSTVDIDISDIRDYYENNIGCYSDEQLAEKTFSMYAKKVKEVMKKNE